MPSTPTAAPAAALGAVAVAVEDLVAGFAGGAARDLSHDELGDLVAETRRLQAQLESVVLAAVGEVDARGSHVHDGALTSGAWLRMHTRASPSEATATTRTARALRTGVLPETAAALAAGEIGARHAQVIAMAVADAPDGAVALIEAEAVQVAREADVRAVAGVMRRFAHALDPDSADEAAVRRYERRGLTLVPTLDGSMALSGLADEVSGAVIAAAVDTAAPLTPGDTRSPAQRRLDGLSDICRRFLADPDAPRRGGGGHPHVLVTVDAQTLAGPDDGSTGGRQPEGADRTGHGSPGATLSWVGPVGGATARRVACDAQLTTVLVGPDGEIRDTRTERRFFTPAQRRAITARDGDRCCWPWCDRPAAWSDAHHIIPAAAGGPTTVDNGCLPCEGHHLMSHEGHWTLTRLTDGRYQARHRDGRTLGPEPHPPGHHRPPRHRRE